MKNIALLFTFVCLLLASQSAYAVNTTKTVTNQTFESVNTEDRGILSKKAVKRQARLEKRVAKIQKKIVAQKIDFNDDTEKWMWFWILGWATAIVIPIIAGAGSLLAILAGLAGLFGTISLIIWLVKKFA